MSGDSLGDRMKRYEQACRTTLPLRIPMILRIDGRAFHTWTHGLERPFDRKLMTAMDATAIALCEDVQGAVFAYVQSDEISILVHNYKRLQSQAWFDNEVQKIVSVAASIAGAEMTVQSWSLFPGGKRATFDCRAFIVSEAEVCNYFIWRQQDASRNSVQMLARSLYSHAVCENKNNQELQEMCFQKGKNWNDLPVEQRRGRCVYKDNAAERAAWIVDHEPPIFTQDRDYVERYLEVEPETEK